MVGYGENFFDNIIYHDKTIHGQQCDNPDQCIEKLEIVKT